LACAASSRIFAATPRRCGFQQKYRKQPHAK
jgi:hypothetical protein